MKATHTLYLLFITLLCVAGFTACDDSGSDDMIWDFAPIELHIAVQDAQGNDLLNPETPGNIAKQGIKAIYNGKIYEKDVPISQTKAYLAHFNGLQTMKFETGKYFLLKSATKLFSVLLASKRPLITELADKLRLKYPLLPTISPCPTMRLEAIRSIIPISCRRYPKSV